MARGSSLAQEHEGTHFHLRRPMPAAVATRAPGLQLPHDDTSTSSLTALSSTWQCNPQDGSVQRNGVTVDASIPCNWGLTGPKRNAEAKTSSCAGAETLAAIEKKELDRRKLQVVLVRHDEDISWSDSFAAVRTVYDKPGTELPTLPLEFSSAGAGPVTPEAASVVLPNVGREQHVFLTHIVRNYDSLADWTAFLHGKVPSCSYFLADPNLRGNHLLTNVSALDYLTPEGDLFMPLTGRTNHDLTLSSFRSTFADGLDPRPRVPRPVTAYPTHGDIEREAEEGGGDRWLKWEVNDLHKYAKEAALKLGVLRADELIDFPAFFQRVVGRAPPAVLYFAQGAQFAASRAALRSTPKETYQWILEQVEAGHFEVTFYLEMIWRYVLHCAPEADWTAVTIDRKEAAPFLDHLVKERLLLRANADYDEQRRSLDAPLEPSPEPEAPLMPPPHSPPPPATARSVALGVGFCRGASGSKPWSTSSSCLDTVQECGQACEATADCACFAHTSPAANPSDFDGCRAAGNGRCVLYIGPAIATQSSGPVGYIAHRLDPAPPSPPPSPPPPPATARSVALGVGFCRGASDSKPWSTSSSCLDTVQECGQACEATVDCACFAHTWPAANPEDSDRCKSDGRGRCVLYIGPAIATQSSGRAGYIAHRLDPAPAPPPPPLPPPPATARSVALGVGFCRGASGSKPWSTSSSCLDTVQECGQSCEATVDCACFAHTWPAANPDNSDRCKSDGRGRCVLYIGPAIATQSSGRAGYIAHRLDPAPSPPPPPSPPAPPPPPLAASAGYRAVCCSGRGLLPGC